MDAMMMMMQLNPEMGACINEAGRLHTILRNSPALANFTIKHKRDDSYCFHVLTPLRGISVAVPPDANRWRVVDEGGIPNIYEIALLDDECKGLKYDESLGYEDICRFDSPDEIIAEIVRLSTAVSNNVPDPKPESEHEWTDSDSESGVEPKPESELNWSDSEPELEPEPEPEPESAPDTEHEPVSSTPPEVPSISKEDCEKRIQEMSNELLEMKLLLQKMK